MTERMEPTNRLRWVRRKTVVVDHRDGSEYHQDFVLQQLWIEDVPDALSGLGRKEWRDVPMEDA